MSIVVKAGESITIEGFAMQEMLIRKNASVVHIVPDMPQQNKASIRLEQNASYRALYFQHNNDLELTVDLDEPGTGAEIYSIFIADDIQSSDIHINHNASRTRSHAFLKGIASGTGRADINLNTYVRDGLRNIDGYQLVKGILLDKESVIRSKPELSIHSEDAKCSHGSAIGTLDRSHIFYMNSRGIDTETAKKILVRSFLEEVVNNIEDGALHTKFINKLEALHV